MKTFAVLAFGLISFNLFADYTLVSGVDNTFCRIENNTVSKTTYFHKNKLSFTKTTKVATEGVEEMVKAAVEKSKNVRISETMYFRVEFEGGQTVELNFKDSTEAASLIHFMSAACN